MTVINVLIGLLAGAIDEGIFDDEKDDFISELPSLIRSSIAHKHAHDAAKKQQH